MVHNANGSLLVHDAAIQAGAMLEAHKPDLVLLTTPHGIELSSDYALYMNTNASGFAQIGADLHNASFPGYKVPLSVGLDPDVAGECVCVRACACACACADVCVCVCTSFPTECPSCTHTACFSYFMLTFTLNMID